MRHDRGVCFDVRYATDLEVDLLTVTANLDAGFAACAASQITGNVAHSSRVVGSCVVWQAVHHQLGDSDAIKLGNNIAEFDSREVVRIRGKSGDDRKIFHETHNYR